MLRSHFPTLHFVSAFKRGLQEAVVDAAKKYECNDLKLGRPVVINHLQWTAALTHNGNPDVMGVQWERILF